MKRISIKSMFFIACLLLFFAGKTQVISAKLQKAFQQFENDKQLKYAISSLYVIDAATGKVVFDKNSQIGLAPASTQKIITSVTAFELLGQDYRFHTKIGIQDKGNKKMLLIQPSGDPTFGSWRWNYTTTSKLFERIKNALLQKQIKKIDGVLMDTMHWSSQHIPDGWTMQDIGNYYGAGSGPFTWRENQYDVFLKSGNAIGDAVAVVATDPPLYNYPFVSELRSAAKGTGDNAYIYFPFGETGSVIRGTIPIGESRFKISGAMHRPEKQFAASLKAFLKNDIEMNDSVAFVSSLGDDVTVIHIEVSPELDSVIYWFNQKSINLYGEALLKTMALEKTGFASTDSGLAVVKKFWMQKGIDENELNAYDGSGLSPLNRVTTRLQVQLLQYARNKKWFHFFYNALPEYNNMKMKSGTINNVKGFCGYHRAKNEKEYVFSFLINNYSGSSGSLVRKMYAVLDVLK